MAFTHAITTHYVDNVPRPVQDVPSAIIGLVGSAPMYLVDSADRTINDPQRSRSDVDDAKYFGSKKSGFTIPYALDAIRANGGGDVEVINVFNIATHKTTAQAISYTFPTTGSSVDKIQLKRVSGTAPSQSATTTNAEGLTGTFTVTNTGASTTYTLATDYTYDATTGILTRVSGGAIASGATVEVTYDYADPSLVSASDIIGAVVDQDRTGLKALSDVYGLRGYKVKQIICPGFSDNNSVAAEMEVQANTEEAIFILDAPLGATRDEAIAGRNGTAPVTNFQYSNRRGILAYPRVYDAQETPELQPLSQYLAGVIARTDKDHGYHWSPSNKQIEGITGIETPLTGGYTSTTTDVHALNAAGITTVNRDFGSGFLAWGNYSALYPSDTTPPAFIPVSRTLDIFHESLQLACRPFLDRPITNPLIEAVANTADNYVKQQISRNALIEGSKAFYDPAKNSNDNLALGIVTFSCVIMIPTPAQNIRLETELDINLFSNLGAAA